MKKINSEVEKFLQEINLEKNYISSVTKSYEDESFVKACIPYLEEYGAIENFIELNNFSFDLDNDFEISFFGYSIELLSQKCSLFAYINSFSDKRPNPIDKKIFSEHKNNYKEFSKILLTDKIWKKIQSQPEENKEGIRDIIDALTISKKLQFIILTDGFLDDGKYTSQFNELPFQVSFDLWDMVRLYEGRAGGFKENISVNFNDFDASPSCMNADLNSDAEVKTYLSIIPGETLADIFEKYGSKILDKNVRSFLQVTGKVNKGINKTLNETPEKFLSFNNGISITAEKINTQKGVLISLDNMQIVNGGQTTASIHYARYFQDVDVSKVNVAAKINLISSKADLKEVVEKITLYANSQNTVKASDFTSNHPFHKKLEKAFKDVNISGAQKWYYERVRGQYFVEMNKQSDPKLFQKKFPKSFVVTKEDFAKYFMSWEQRPYLVSKGAQSNYNLFMKEFANSLTKKMTKEENFTERYIGAGILFVEIKKIINSLELPSYVANVITYTMSMLSYMTGARMKLDLIFQNLGISDALKDYIQDIAKYLHKDLQKSAKEAGDLNVTQWCKQEDCWLDVRDNIELPDILPEEFGGQYSRSYDRDEKDPYTPDDYKNIQTCLKLSPENWMKFHQWVALQSSANVKYIGVVSTLLGYANAKWNKRPSRKQAYIAAKMINEAEQEGIFESEDAE